MKAKGVTGEIEIAGEVVLLRRAKIIGSVDDSRVVKISELSGVDFRRATLWESGYIRILHAGTKNMAGRLMRSQDRDVIMFEPDQQGDFLKLKDELLTAITGVVHSSEQDSEEKGKSFTVAVQLIMCAIGIALYYFIFVR